MPHSYLICASPRTGSNLLATALRELGTAGRPFEYFNSGVMSDPYMLDVLSSSTANADALGWLDRILLAGTTSNGVFGATVHWWNVEQILVAIGKKQGRIVSAPRQARDRLRSFFPGLLFIWLRRENKVAQAISHYLAIQTGVWYEPSADPVPDPRPGRDVPFDFAAIQTQVDAATYEEDEWRQFLAGALDTTLEITYEELAADFAGTMTRVLAFLGAPPVVNIPKPAYRRLQDARSLEWEQRYRELVQAELSEGVESGE
jgi:trehalose 2-sulfotransferase